MQQQLTDVIFKLENNSLAFQWVLSGAKLYSLARGHMGSQQGENPVNRNNGRLIVKVEHYETSVARWKDLLHLKKLHKGHTRNSFTFYMSV